MPPALPGEFAFAASGTCAATFGKRWAWLGTGGAEEARILATTDEGQTWAAYDTPIVHGTPSSRSVHRRLSKPDAWRSRRRRARAGDGDRRQLRAVERRWEDLGAHERCAHCGCGLRIGLRGKRRRSSQQDRRGHGTGRRGVDSRRGRHVAPARGRRELLGGGVRQPGLRVAGRDGGAHSEDQLLRRRSRSALQGRLERAAPVCLRVRLVESGIARCAAG